MTPLSLSPIGQWFLTTKAADNLTMSPHVARNAGGTTLRTLADLGATPIPFSGLASHLVSACGIPKGNRLKLYRPIAQVRVS
jgi:hypothetical protein